MESRLVWSPNIVFEIGLKSLTCECSCTCVCVCIYARDYLFFFLILICIYKQKTGKKHTMNNNDTFIEPHFALFVYC